MLIPRRFPGPLAGAAVCVFSFIGPFFETVQTDSRSVKRTFHWVLLHLLLVLLHRCHAAGVNQLPESLQVSYGFVHQLRVSGDGFQSEHNDAT